MPTPFASTKMSAIAFQLGATRVAQPSFTQIAVSRGEPAAASTVVAQPAKPTPTGVPVAGPALTAPIQNIRFIDPVFAQNIINLRPPTEGVPRGQITVPVSPSDNVTDELIFEGASDPSLKFYIPRYRLTQQAVGGEQRYQIALQQSGEEWTLTVHLQKYRAPAIATVAPEATEMDHRIAVFLKHNQFAGGNVIGTEELEFPEKTIEPNGIRAVLRGNTIAARDLTYLTLTDPAYGAVLIVRKWVTVAVPVPKANGQTQSIPTTVVRDHRTNEQTRPGATTIVRDHRTNVMAMPQMARFGAFQGIAVGEMDPTAKPPEPLFRQVDRVVDDCVSPNPFVFPPALHGYIFGAISATPGERFELIRHQVTWPEGSAGRPYSYYQNPVRSYQFYYLPDAFKIARRPQSPHEPMMSVRYAATEGSLDDVQVALDYIALPFVDPKRLEAAVSQLQSSVTDPLPPGVNTLTYEPLLNPTDKTHLLLAIPRADATSKFDERKDASVDLRSGIKDSLALLMPQFQAVYDAMFGSSDILLSGTVTMDLGGDQESIPFAVRMNDLIGQIFDYSESPSDGGAIRATFRNAIESPVEIHGLSATLRRGEERFPASIQGLDFSSPIRLEPNQELSFQVVPSPLVRAASVGSVVSVIKSAISGGAISSGDFAVPATKGPLTCEYDLDDVEVVADKEAIFNAILDPSAAGTYLRAITVKTFKQKFDPPVNDPNNQIISLIVDFESGDSVDLNADNLQQVVNLRTPVSDYVLRKVDQGQYRYKLRTVRLSGITEDPDWRTDNRSLLLAI
jgi:hypothetical protein